MWWKPICLVLCLVFLSACVSEAPQARTYSILFNQRESSPYQSDWLILQEYEKRQNVTLDVRLGDDADYGNAVKQTMNSGDIPDIILKVWPTEVESYSTAGLLLPFSDYEDQMPHFKAYIDTHNLRVELDKLRLSDGKYYILPGYQRQIQVQQWIYRKDLFEAYGLGVPDTYDELFDALVVLKEAYPDSTPINGTWGGAHLFSMMGAGYGIPAGWSGTNWYNSATDRWQYAPASDEYRAMYTFLNHCYEAGLLDPLLFSQSTTEYEKRLVNGSTFVAVSWVTSGYSNLNEQLAANGVSAGEWAPLPVMESTIGIRALPAVNPFRKGLIVPVRVLEEEYFEDLLRFIDWAVYSEEGLTLTYWGVEGLTYENTPGGKALVPEIITPKNPDGTMEAETVYGLNQFFNLWENEEFEDYKKPDLIVAFLERSLEEQETLPPAPTLVLDANSVEAIRLVNEKLEPYVAEASLSFITGEVDIDTDWEVYLQELNALGYLTLEELWNTSWAKQTSQE